MGKVAFLGVWRFVRLETERSGVGGRTKRGEFSGGLVAQAAVDSDRVVLAPPLAIWYRASGRPVKISPLSSSSRMRLLKDSTKPFSQGEPAPESEAIFRGVPCGGKRRHSSTARVGGGFRC
jgi:hypothetical protein